MNSVWTAVRVGQHDDDGITVPPSESTAPAPLNAPTRRWRTLTRDRGKPSDVNFQNMTCPPIIAAFVRERIPGPWGGFVVNRYAGQYGQLVGFMRCKQYAGRVLKRTERRRRATAYDDTTFVEEMSRRRR